MTSEQQRALAALEDALFDEIGARFRVVLVSEYGAVAGRQVITGPVGRPALHAKPGPGNLDGAVANFDRGLGDLLVAYARCRDVIARRFAQPENTS